MDQQTFDLLEFDSIRRILAGYASTTLGKQRASEVAPGTRTDAIRAELLLVSEMVGALQSGQTPPLSGIHDVRLVLRRAEIGTMLTAEQLLQIADTLIATGAIYRYRMRLDGKYARLIEMLSSVEDLGTIAKSITNCIDGRGHVVDSASPELAAIRQSMAELDERAKHEVNRLLRDPEIRKILRYTNATLGSFTGRAVLARRSS
jgi:DNA mismatch repair protein MutS2